MKNKEQLIQEIKSELHTLYNDNIFEYNKYLRNSINTARNVNAKFNNECMKPYCVYDFVFKKNWVESYIKENYCNVCAVAKYKKQTLTDMCDSVFDAATDFDYFLNSCAKNCINFYKIY